MVCRIDGTFGCPADLSLGGDIQPKKDLTYRLKWPKYVRLQRQKVVLNKRLKIPPALNQFNHTLDKNTASQLFRFVNKYRPESKEEKTKRLRETAQAAADEKQAKDKVGCPLWS